MPKLILTLLASKSLLLCAAGLGFAMAVWIASTVPASAAYCAMYFNGTRSCGIPTLDMCVQATRGVGGTCQQDFTDQLRPNFVQRMRTRNAAMPPPRPLPPGAAGPFRPLDTSPCMSLSGDRCGNYLH